METCEHFSSSSFCLFNTVLNIISCNNIMKNGKIYFLNYPDIWQYNKTLVPYAVMYHSDWGKVLTNEKVSSSLDCPRMLVMKHFNTRIVQRRNSLELLTPKSKLNDNWCYMHCKVTSPLYKLMSEVMFWFIMYVNKSIESTHHERVHFQRLK